MATIPRLRRSQILSATLAVFLAAPETFAKPPEPTGAASFRDILKTGDVIAVTPWSGKKVKGRFVEATECSIRLDTGGKSLTIETAAIKTVRSYPAPKENAGKAMVGAVERCDRTDCAPITLAVVGVAVLVQGFRDLGRKATVVYRGNRAQPTGVSCSENSRVSAFAESTAGRTTSWSVLYRRTHHEYPRVSRTFVSTTWE